MIWVYVTKVQTGHANLVLPDAGAVSAEGERGG